MKPSRLVSSSVSGGERKFLGRLVRGRWVHDQRGAIAAFVAMGIAVFLGIAALAVDLGMLMTARSEAQRTADGAALAGAAGLIYNPNNVPQARLWAKQYASQNDVRGSQIVLRDQDIDVILPDKVRVRVLRTQNYGGAVPTLFARMFGVYDVDVATVAAAEWSADAARVSCLLPVALPDRWVNFLSLEWDPSEGDYYEPPYLNGQPNPNYSGYGTLGELVTLLPSQGGKGGGPTDAQSTRLEPGYWDLWLPQGLSGTSEVRTRILGCPDGQENGYIPTDPMWREAGNRQTLADAFQQIINDPRYSGQYYDPACTCARDSNNGNAVVTGGLRYRSVPIFDPNTFTQQGSGPHFLISHFVGVFIDSVDPGPPGQANVYARIMPTVGFGNNDPGVGPVVKVLRLVE
jgi:hypothetical protein